MIIKISSRLGRQLVWEKTNGEEYKAECYAGCGVTLKCMTGWEMGHDEPKSKGGTDDLDNLRPICLKCNRQMGNRYTIEQWKNRNNSFREEPHFLCEEPVLEKRGIKRKYSE